MTLSDRGLDKVFGVVTNRGLAGDELVWWARLRCGTSEAADGVLKSDLAGGRLPSRLFGANAAWWAVAVLAFNVSSAMKRLVLGGEWTSRRLKAYPYSDTGAGRFAIIALPGRLVRRVRKLILRLPRGPSLIRVAAQGAAEDTVAVRRRIPPIDDIGIDPSIEGESIKSSGPSHAIHRSAPLNTRCTPPPPPPEMPPRTFRWGIWEDVSCCAVLV